MPALLKCQQFKNSKSDTTESKVSKLQCVDSYNNKKRQGLNKYEDNDDKFVFFSLYL